MKNYFDGEGHLTGEALSALIHGEPDELSRLEIAEHLSFCDACTERYTALLCEEDLLAPPEPLKRTVLQHLRQRIRVIFINRYIAAGVAACFTLLLWFGGAFTAQIEVASQPKFEHMMALSETLADKTQKAGVYFSDSINQFFSSISNFDWKGVHDYAKK